MNQIKSKIVRLHKISILAFALFALSSCEKALEEKTYSSFTGDNFFKDPESAELGAMGIYDRLGTQDLYGQRYLLYFMSSDLQRHWRQGRGNDDDRLSNFDIQENNGVLGMVWSALYDGIYRANLVIDRVTPLRDAAETSSERSGDLEIYNNVLGDAHFLRGFMYFQLVKNWGDVPLRLSSDISFNDLKIERSPAVEIYQQIESDILEAISLLPDASNVKSPGRISKGAAQGILARIYLQWAGNPIKDVTKFEKAAELSWEVVQSGLYSLNTVIEPTGIGEPFDNPFPQVFKNLAEKISDPSEIMWEINFSFPADSPENGSYIGAWYGVNSNTKSIYKRGSTRWFPLPSFYDSFEPNDTLRRDWSIAKFEIDKNDNFVPIENDLKWGIGKYRRYLMNPKSPDNNVDAMNWPVIRYADVLLMLAESINETLENGGTLPPGLSISTAYNSINQVRRRARKLALHSPNASVDLSGSGGSILRQQIRDERAWELCFEGIRRYDLMRWGTLVDAIKQAGEKLQLDGYDVAKNYFPAANVEEKHNLLPIPFMAEITQNPNILNTDPTNNGYR